MFLYQKDFASRVLECSLVRCIFPADLKLDGQNSIPLLYDVSFLAFTAFNMHCSRVDLGGNISSLSRIYLLPYTSYRRVFG